MFPTPGKGNAMRLPNPSARSQRKFSGVMAIFYALFSGMVWGADNEPLASANASASRVSLTSGQAGATLLLDQVRPEKTVPLFLFTDPNKDPDDLSVLVVTRFLQEHRLVDLRCVVTTLGDRSTRRIRARFARCVLDDLRLQTVKVGVGVDYDLDVKDSEGVVDVKASEGRQKDHRIFIDTPLLCTNAVVDDDGQKMLRHELSLVEDQSAVLLVNCGMADVAAFLMDSPELVRQKVARVVIMGGVEAKLDERGFVVADKRAYNNSTHQPSADYTYSRVQELGLPLVIVTKEAAYSAAVPRSFYDGMAATQHPVGEFLRAQQKQSLRQLWEGIVQGHLPPALTPEWFFGTFTDVGRDGDAGKAAIARARSQADDFESIWNEVSKFNLYDPLALLAATPGAADLVFKGHAPEGIRSKARLIAKNDLKDPSLLKDLLAGIAIESLNTPMPLKSRNSLAPGYPQRVHVDEADASWDKPLPGYDPPEYTAAVVIQHEGEWADPSDVSKVDRPFVTQTGSVKNAVSLNAQGRPLNPLGRTGLQGRGLLGQWGRNVAGDALLTRDDPQSGKLQLLVIARKDSGLKALPGGMTEPGESTAETVARELYEETGAKLSFDDATVLFVGVVDDPRNTDNSWMETTVLSKHLSAKDQDALTLQAGDDATAVRWINIDNDLLSNMYASHADYVRLQMLKMRTPVGNEQ